MRYRVVYEQGTPVGRVRSPSFGMRRRIRPAESLATTFLTFTRDRDPPVVAVHEVDRDTDVRLGPADVDRSLPCGTCRSSHCQPL